jgi:hypothetical protein
MRRREISASSAHGLINISWAPTAPQYITVCVWWRRREKELAADVADAVAAEAGGNGDAGATHDDAASASGDDAGADTESKAEL